MAYTSISTNDDYPNKEITYPEFAVILDSILVIFLDIVGEVVDGDVVILDVFHDLCGQSVLNVSTIEGKELTLFLKPRSSPGVRESALPMTGITLTRGERRRISSISISLRLVECENTSFRAQRKALTRVQWEG